MRVEESERWTTLVPVLVTVWCPHCEHKVERLIVLHREEAQTVEKAFKHKFAGIVEVRVIKGEELINWIRGRR